MNNFTFQAIPQAMHKTEEICLSKPEFLQQLKDICVQASIIKPAIFIGLAIILDFTEYFSRKYLVAENKILFQWGFYKIESRELYVLISTAKTFSMVIALFFVLMGINAWG